jgi:hypothetical protein
MERLDSCALGSSPRSTALDAEVEHSMVCDESQALGVRKVSRTQKLDGKECAASKLADVLRLRKLKNGHAKYWDQLAVDIVSTEEKQRHCAMTRWLCVACFAVARTMVARSMCPTLRSLTSMAWLDARQVQSCKHTDAQAKNTHAHISIR